MRWRDKIFYPVHPTLGSGFGKHGFSETSFFDRKWRKQQHKCKSALLIQDKGRKSRVAEKKGVKNLQREKKKKKKLRELNSHMGSKKHTTYDMLWPPSTSYRKISLNMKFSKNNSILFTASISRRQESWCFHGLSVHRIELYCFIFLWRRLCLMVQRQFT